ncbi:hypothetical protein R50072_18930 [Simiduia litorea]|uniref:FliH/SctL family protein n=1 Tax=Simiduia litorea TaxID=1435348 RepID=UPI0036F3F673
MASPDKAYISAENATHAVTWMPPQVGQQANKVPTAEKEAREAERRQAERAKERVEDVEPAKLPTAEEIAAVFDAARKEGFAEGLAAGMAQGFEKGREDGTEKSYAEHHAEAERLKTQLQNMIGDLSGPTEQQQQHISNQLTQVIKRLTRKLVLTELSTPSPHIENLVAACVALLPATQTTRRAVIQLHPDDLAYLRGEAELASILTSCEWQSNSDVLQGGCVVTSQSSLLDASVESQLQALFEHFDDGSFANDVADEPEVDTGLTKTHGELDDVQRPPEDSDADLTGPQGSSDGLTDDLASRPASTLAPDNTDSTEPAGSVEPLTPTDLTTNDGESNVE